MKQRIQKMALAGLFILMINVSASADFIFDTDMSGWLGSAVTIGDKTFTLTGYSGIDGTDAVHFIGDSAGNYAVNVADLGNNTPGAIGFNYTVQVNDPRFEITRADVNSDIQLGAAAVDKSFTDGLGHVSTLSSSGSFATTAVPATQFLSVHVTTTGGGGTIFSISDGYHQSLLVPEPSSIALLGIGIAFVAFRRRQRTA